MAAEATRDWVGVGGPEYAGRRDRRHGRGPRGSTTREGFAVLGVAIRREPWIFTALHPRQRALRRAHRRRRVGARLVDRPRRAARRSRTARSATACCWPVLGALPRRRDPARGRHRGAPPRRRRHAVPHAGAHPPRRHPSVPLAADGVAPAPPDRPAALQRQRRRRGRLGPDRAAADGGRHGRDDGDRDRADVRRRPGARPGRAAGLPGRDRRQPRLPAARLAADDPRPAAARRGQRDRARVLRRRPGRQDAGPRGRGDASGSPRAPTSCATSTSAPGGCGRRSTRPWPRCRASACSSCSPSGCRRVLSGATDAGDVVTVAYLLTIVSFPIRSIGWLLGEFPRSVVGFRRVTVGARGDRRDAVRRPPCWPVAAATAAGARLVVDAPRLLLRPRRSGCSTTSASTVEPGRTVALVGATASGKSTLTTLMTRLVDPDGGRILLDGTDLRDLARGELAGAVAIVPQTAFLFDDTVRGNVTLGADVSDEEVWAALRAAQADGFVAALPHGLDTRLGERGTSLSGRPAAADLAGPRAGAPAPAADPRRRHLRGRPRGRGADPGRAALRRRAAPARPGDTGPTLVVVAYRKATIGLADEVVHLEDGRIADRGTHRELLGRSPSYARLVNAYEQPRHPERPASGGEPREHHHRRAPPAPRGWTAARRSPPSRRSAAACASRPELKEGIGGTLVLAVLASLGQVVVPIAVQQTLDRGLNGPDGPDVRFTVLMGLVAAARRRGDQLGVVRHDQPAVHRLGAGAGDAADQGLPPRPRPAAAHPEHRAPRRAGLPGDQRRRPGQPVPRLRRADLRGQRRADAGGDGHHADLQLAAGDRGVGLLRAAVPVAALLPAQALRRLRHRPPPGRRCCSRRSPSRSSAPRSSARTPSRRAPSAASTTRSRRTRRPAPARRASPRSRSPSAASRPGWPTPGVLIVGIWLGFAGDITAGKVLAFAFLVSLFVGPVQMGTQILTDAQNAIAGWRRVIGILDTPADLVDPGPEGAHAAARADRRPLRGRHVRLPERAAGAARRHASTSPPAPGSRSWGRPARASRPSPSCSPG